MSNVEAIILQVRLLGQQPSRPPETRPRPTVRHIWARLSHLLRNRPASPGGGKARSPTAATSYSPRLATGSAATYSPKHA
jgi:hypothetical protein